MPLNPLGSPSFNLNGYDWTKILRIFLVALAGFLLTWGITVFVPYLQESGVLTAALAAMAITILEALRRYVSDNTKTLLVLAAATLSMCSCSSGVAGDVAAVFDGSKPAQYLVTVDGLGGITFSPLDKVVRIGPQPTPNPTPTPDPSPAVLTDRARAIRDSAIGTTGDPGRAETAKLWAALYREIAILARTPGKVKDIPSLSEVTTKATNMFLETRGTGYSQKTSCWQPTRDIFSTQWTLLSDPRRKTPATLVDYASLLDDAASGFDASAPSLRGISPEMLELILSIIKIVLALLGK